jgi:predicted Rossmann fold nucleotide-binding protein DprA/Smf involved in DNA uptake
MNFAQMLLATVAPLPPTRGRTLKVFKGNTDLTPANKRKSEISVAKYKEAMGSGWIHTRAIERRMGMGPSVAYKTLMTYESHGLVERRPTKGEPYNRRKGWEWRWK